jgi:putative drug exporter of the RND superfamily
MGLMHMRRFWVAGIVLIAVVALLPFSYHAERHLETATRVEGSDAETVRQELSNRFHSPFVDQVVLVVEGLPAADSDQGGQALATIVAGLKDEPGVSGIVSYLDLRDPIFLGDGGGTFVLIGLASTDNPGVSVESLVPALHEKEHALEAQLRSQYPAVKLELTGEIPLNFDIRKASADEVRHSESLAIPATLALLLLAFGSFVAALIPLAVGELAIAATLAITGLLARHFHLSILVQNLATMLGLGLGIDYGLLMVSRFREALCQGNDGPAAAAIAARQAGHTLLISASTVAIGFLALLTVPISEIRSIGVAGFLVAGMSVLLANTLWPLALCSQVGCAMVRTHGKSLEAMGKGHCGSSMAGPFSGGNSIAFACLAGHAARYQPSPRELASAGRGIGACAGHSGKNGSGRRCAIVAHYCRATGGFNYSKRRGVECNRSCFQAALERPALLPGNFNHDHCG